MSAVGGSLRAFSFAISRQASHHSRCVAGSPKLCPRVLSRCRCSYQSQRLKARGSEHDSYRQRCPKRQFHQDQTIYALSTAPGRAAIAIIRISGPACLSIYRALCPGKLDLTPRYATVRKLYEPHTAQQPNNLLDSSALVLYFPSPRTVTGEDILELHVHGGPAVVKTVLAAISRVEDPRSKTSRPEIRYAEPGEFTRRAFLNDRLDLTQVEALSDTLSATTEQQRRLSVRGTHSGLAKRYEAWRQQLLAARGELEALIDFSEDQHFDESPAELCGSVAAQARVLLSTLRAHCRNAVKGELLRNGIAISLLGAPNAGKSSLLNCVVGREAAIVSQEAGTTRDVVEVGLDLGGYLCRLGDTAGLRQAKATLEIGGAMQQTQLQDVIGRIEREGMRRAKERAAESDVVIVVLSFEQQPDGTVALHLDPEVIETAAELVKTKDNVTVVINKFDLSADRSGIEQALRMIQAALPGLHVSRTHFTSCKRHAAAYSGDDTEKPHTTNTSASADGPNKQLTDASGIQPFLRALIAHFDDLTAAISTDDPDAVGEGADSSIWQESLGTTERQRILLEHCIEHLKDFVVEVHGEDEMHGASGTPEDADGEDVDIVLAAEHLRGAAQCLAKITGKGADSGDVEEVLGVVFEKFCVGK